ncbi:carboxylesterase/lipase family protein [Blastococcus sp. BMG 814]|uniref:Carboxylic ester hydrolase n=1 Tax=Blastococcus carthaginiensis TaxID=3050034 RepID=A0ABT9I8R2_9ACTN|nr:carboxylesterase/lipase family protein [Blastococcus carthaginiensis]MDP5181965.1 carboxylesterase/lipase family protein [Blastococcus carthaginiensis]
MRTTPPRPARRSLLALGLGAVLTAGALATATVAGAAPDRAPLVVQTTEGAVEGTATDGYRLFEGIPFAAPPVGDLRFAPPAPAQPWDGVLDATTPGSACPQEPSASNPTTSLDEDCLYLNVTTPSGLDTSRRNLPVMVWIHGGSWRTGSGDRYDAGKLALEGDVVVVTINYRLGPLGFMAQEDLSRENGDVASGSAGLLDQQAALRWVERNIRAFGGNPGRVTIFGESAGGSAVCAQLTSPSARGLFDRAIAQSYSCTAPYDTLETAEAKGARVAETVGCAAASDVAACLRATPVQQLLDAWPGGAFVVGGSALPVQPAEAIAAGNHAKVPVMHGNLSDENTLFTPLDPTVARLAADGFTGTDYTTVLAGVFGDNADEVLARYPADAYPSPLRALAAVNSDAGSALSTCEHVDAYDTLARPPAPAPVFAYQFRDETADPLVDFPYPAYPEDAQHATELPYLFPGLFGDGLNAEQERLSTAMVRYWTNFAAHGNPNGRDVPTWTRYRASKDVQGLDIASDGGIGPVDVAAEADCAFWSTLS